MAPQLGNSRKADGTDFTPGAVRDEAAPTPVARRWRSFLTGPRLPPGPALVIIVLASLVLWAALITLLYYTLHR